MGEPIDTALGIASTFDWISPLAALVQDLANGPSHTFLIPWAGCPLSGPEISRLLRKRGVRCWGMMVVSGTLMVSVRLNQARWAQHLLEGAGVPIENPVGHPMGNFSWGSAGSPGSKRSPGSRSRSAASVARRSRILCRLAATRRGRR